MRKFRVTVNGNTYEVEVEELQGGQSVATTAQATMAPATETLKVNASAAGNTKIESPMQGKIIGVKISQGQSVQEGEVIAILEAMKMENEIVAPKAGTVASINVATGQSVEAGDLIASLN